MNWPGRWRPPASFTAGTFVLLGGLYFAQGLPFGFFTQALPVVLRRSGYSLITISATGVLFLPWALKFLWAPYVDRYGTRRRWLIGLQLACAATALALAAADVSTTFAWLFLGVAVINLFSATQDVVTDGMAVRLLGVADKGIGNGIQVGAYRIGMVVGGGMLLWLYGVAGWRPLFVVMAVLLLAAIIPVWLLRSHAARADAGGRSADRPRPAQMAVMWWHRLRRPGMVTVVALVACYKFGNSMGSALIGPFLSDRGLSIGTIAFIDGGLSSVSAIAGAGVGAWLAHRYGRRRALLLGGVAQTAALSLYILSSVGIGGVGLIVAASVTEHVLGGAATVVVFSLMMDAAEPRYAGSDFTLLASAVVVAQGVAGVVAAVVAQGFGYPMMFAASLGLSGLGCYVVLRALTRGVGTADLRVALATR
ncbi:MFS transporter [Williamsia sp. CHRR-6]|nr:MFS transporter [Williamsia sp. CHRR-6]